MLARARTRWYDRRAAAWSGCRCRSTSSPLRLEKNASATALSADYPANRGLGRGVVRLAGRSVGFAVGLAAFEVAEPFFVVSDWVGECFEADGDRLPSSVDVEIACTGGDGESHAASVTPSGSAPIV